MTANDPAPTPSLWKLQWEGVDPATHPFDPDAVFEVVRSVAPPGPPTWEWQSRSPMP